MILTRIEEIKKREGHGGQSCKKDKRVRCENKEEESSGSAGNFRKDERKCWRPEIGKNSTETAK